MDEKCLELLLAVSKVTNRGRGRKQGPQQAEDGESEQGNVEEQGLPLPPHQGEKKFSF